MVSLKLENVGSPTTSTCCLTESWLSHLILVFHCYFKIIFLSPSKSPAPLTTSLVLLITVNYQPLSPPFFRDNFKHKSSVLVPFSPSYFEILVSTWIIYPSLWPSHSSTSSLSGIYSFISPYLSNPIYALNLVVFSDIEISGALFSDY